MNSRCFNNKQLGAITLVHLHQEACDFVGDNIKFFKGVTTDMLDWNCMEALEDTKVQEQPSTLKAPYIMLLEAKL